MKRGWTTDDSIIDGSQVHVDGLRLEKWSWVSGRQPYVASAAEGRIGLQFTGQSDSVTDACEPGVPACNYSAFLIEVLYVVLPADQVSQMKDAPIAHTEVSKDKNKQQKQQQKPKSNNNNNNKNHHQQKTTTTTTNNNDTHIRHIKNYQTITLINKPVHLSILSFSPPYIYTHRE